MTEKLLRALGYCRGWLTGLIHFSSPEKFCQHGRIRIIKKNAQISVGKRTHIWPNVKFSCQGGNNAIAKLSVGSHCNIGDRLELHCGQEIRIGNHVYISWDCVIMDRDYHSTDSGEELTAPVHIEDGAWIGCRSIILKGVTIGANAVVAAGSVVTKDVAPGSLVAGNPARFKRNVSGHYNPK